MADYYDKYRPGYPEHIITTIIRKAKMTISSKLLEIGAGSGKATAQFAEYGFEMLCVEIGEDLVKKGNERFGDKNIKFVASRFEDYPLPSEYFDAIISAQAFHWLTQPLGYEKCAKTLKSGGYLAPFWNIDITRDNDVDREFYSIVSKYGPVSCMPEADYQERMDRISSGIIESGLFLKPEIIHATQEQNYSPDEYYSYMQTSQVFALQPDSAKQSFREEITQFAAKHDGVIRRLYTCELYLAQKK
jgi:ubiquinone/menaquinone biosynthesis C-methylase UbiE